jgi:hypothetical protein
MNQPLRDLGPCLLQEHHAVAPACRVVQAGAVLPHGVGTVCCAIARADASR